MRRIFSDLKQASRDTPPAIRTVTLIGLVFVILMFALCLTQGCASTPAGLSREQGLYRAATNTVASLTQFVPYVPAPLNSAAEVLLAATSAALTAWNANQHRRIKQLEAKTNGNRKPTDAPRT